jgi:hypothetical protein
MPPAFGHLPFLRVQGAESLNALPAVMVWYHEPAFALLHRRLGDRIEHALLTAPAQVLARHLIGRLPTKQEIAAEVAWPAVRGLLDVLEAEMADVLRTRSVCFWLHLYRRIGVMLHPHHESNTDPRTVMLVRQIVELAITKHGRATDADELVPSNRVKPDLILGGFMRAGIKARFKPRFTKTYQRLTQSLRDSPQMVIKEFAEDDFVRVYLVEGLAYQYWRVTALLRALGKGARVTVDEDGTWNYASDEELWQLIECIDTRTEKQQLEGSLLGTWFDEKIKRNENSRSSMPWSLICPVYNVERLSAAWFFDALGLPLAGDHVSNFLPAPLDVGGWLKAHGFLADAFREQHGYRLETFVATLWAMANIVLFPRTWFLAKSQSIRDRVFRYTLMNTLQRGYGMFEIGPDRAVPELLRHIESFLPEVNVTEAEVRAVLDRLTFTPAAQAHISLWSGGPRYMVIPVDLQQAMVDLQGVPTMLVTLFVRLAHDQAHRGPVFEEAFRRTLLDRGFQVRRGRLSSVGGASRELDAGVIIGDDLFVFECVSAQRPLDYEIGNPTTLARRRERLDDKVTQVLELAEFLETNPSGTNYDFGGVRRIVPLVVSPFVEWLWDRSVRLWLSDGTPRILSAGEALDLIEEARRKVVS